MLTSLSAAQGGAGWDAVSVDEVGEWGSGGVTMSPVVVFSPQRRKPREDEVPPEGGAAPVVATRTIHGVNGGQAAATAVVVTRGSRVEESVECVEEGEVLILN
jgi:hypothetical protein